MAIIYVPMDPEDRQRMKEQKKFLSKLINEGWTYLSNVNLTDAMGTEIQVAVLREKEEKSEGEIACQI